MSWDYIIIGAGSAGCAVAYALAHHGRNERMLIVEAGGSDRSPFIRIPAGQMRAIASRDWRYRSEPDPTRNGTSEDWARGRVLGGSSSINGTMYVRGAHRDFDRWASLCGASDGGGWTAKELMPMYRDMECSDQSGPLRGQSGPLFVRTVKHPHLTTQAFVRSARARGHAYNLDYNGDTQAGVSYAQLSQHRGFRCSAADAFLRPLLSRPNVKLLLDSTVRRINMEHGRAVGVELSRNGRTRLETAREIILCAGAINTPQLLMLSGIGEAEELARHKIAVAIDLPGVGRNLKEHPLINLTYRTTVETYNLTGGLRQKIGMAMQFLRTREGPVANLFEAVAFLKSSPASMDPDIQLHFMPMGFLPTSGGALGFAGFPAVTVMLNPSYPRSQGRIRLSGARPEDPPRIECRLLDAAADIDTLVSGIQVVRDIMQTKPMSDLLAEEITPGPQAQDPASIEDYVRGHTSIAYHPASTCRMGVGRDAVVGPNLRVHGTENLWVADASIMPNLISGNTNAVCMLIGLKLGRQLASKATSAHRP